MDQHQQVAAPLATILPAVTATPIRLLAILHTDQMPELEAHGASTPSAIQPLGLLLTAARGRTLGPAMVASDTTVQVTHSAIGTKSLNHLI